MAVDILITIALVLLNGLFVAAEFAIVKVRSSQIAIQTGTSSKKAAQVIIDNLDGFLAATQLGITIASLGLGWVGEDVVTKIILNLVQSLGFEMSENMAHGIALPIAFTLLTVMHIVFGELAPKSIAIRYPTSTTLALSIPLRIFHFIFKPFITVLNGFSNLILKMFGIRPVNEHEIHSEEELRMIIAESEEGGAIERNERELIQNVFDFDDRLVKQVMVPRIKITAININSTLEETVTTVFREGYSRYPVYERSLDEIVGILYAKDVLQHYVEKTGKSLAEIIRKAYFITESKRVDHVLREFQRKKVQMAIVISEYGGTIGIVTLEDILEELVGEIQDEHDQEVQVVTKVGNGWQVIATAPIRDINRMIDPPFEESEEYETLAGLLLNQRPFDLKEEEEVEADGYKIKILKMNRSLPELVELKFVGETVS